MKKMSTHCMGNFFLSWLIIFSCKDTLSAQSQSDTCTLPEEITVTEAMPSKCLYNDERSASESLHSLFEEYWQWKLKEYPEDATVVGLHQYDDQLTNVSMEAFNLRYSKVLEFIQKVEGLQGCLKDPKEALNAKLLKIELLGFKKGHKYNGYYLPLYNLNGIQRDIKKLFQRMPLSSFEDYQKMLSRMQKIPTKIDQLITLMRAGMRQGLLQHHLGLKNMNETLAKLAIKEPSKSYFYSRYFEKNFPATLTAQEILEIQNAAEDSIRNLVGPAFAKLKLFVQEEYVTRESIAFTSLPNGDEMYQRLIRIHTSTNLKPQQIHDLGLCEVKRLNAQMGEISEDLGFANKTAKEVTSLLKNNPNNYFENEKDLIEAYEAIVKRVDLELPKIFKRIPKAPVIVRGDPSPFVTSGYYRGPTFDGSRPGTFFAGTHTMKSHPKYNMVTLTLHEASPGHHHQNAHLMEFSGAPLYKRVALGEGTYLPSGFESHTSYSEGWGLYSEKLGFDMGLFNNSFDLVGHISWEMLRSCRLVVDTGMHALGWTREEAIQFMLDNLAFSREAIVKQIDRYIMVPAQALGYKIGQMKISQLRSMAEEKLGTKFDIKEFHDLILNIGEVPLTIIEDEVSKHIQQNLV